MPDSLEDSQKKFEGWRSALNDMFIRASNHLQIALSIEKLIQEHTREMNMAPAFWGLTMSVHLHYGLLNLANLVSKNPRSVSMARLLDYVEKHLEMFSKDAFAARYLARRRGSGKEGLEHFLEYHKVVTRDAIEEHRKQISEFDLDLSNLKKWRDKVLAHVDEAFVSKGVSIDKLYPLYRDRSFKALDKLLDIFNFYSGAYDASSYSISVPFEPGLQTMIMALAEWRQARRNKTRTGPKQSLT